MEKRTTYPRRDEVVLSVKVAPGKKTDNGAVSYLPDRLIYNAATQIGAADPFTFTTVEHYEGGTLEYTDFECSFTEDCIFVYRFLSESPEYRFIKVVTVMAKKDAPNVPVMEIESVGVNSWGSTETAKGVQISTLKTVPVGIAPYIGPVRS